MQWKKLIITSIIFQPKMCNLIVVMRKLHRPECWETFYKIMAYNFQNQSWKSRKIWATLPDWKKLKRQDHQIQCIILNWNKWQNLNGICGLHGSNILVSISWFLWLKMSLFCRKYWWWDIRSAPVLIWFGGWGSYVYCISTFL